MKKQPKLEWFVTPNEDDLVYKILPPFEAQILGVFQKKSVNQTREEMGFCPICELEVLASTMSVKRRDPTWPTYKVSAINTPNPCGEIPLAKSEEETEQNLIIPTGIEFLPLNIEIGRGSCLSHVWSHYIGFREEYDYCVNCDKKREENDPETYSYKIHRITVD